MKAFRNIEYIEAWFTGQMDEATRKAFEAQLTKDEELRQEVEAYEKIFMGFTALRDEHFASEVARWAKQSSAQKKTQSKQTKTMKGKTASSMKKPRHSHLATYRSLRPMMVKLAVAAAVMLMLIAAFWVYQSRQYTNEKLASKVYVPMLSSNTMGASDEKGQALLQSFEQAHELFQQGKYEEASDAFKAFITSVENNRNVLDPLTRQVYLENAQWTALLSDFAAGKIPDDKMMKILSVLSRDTTSAYSGKAKELQEALQSSWRKGN